jgi:hypothetical protein
MPVTHMGEGRVPQQGVCPRLGSFSCVLFCLPVSCHDQQESQSACGLLLLDIHWHCELAISFVLPRIEQQVVYCMISALYSTLTPTVVSALCQHLRGSTHQQQGWAYY